MKKALSVITILLIFTVLSCSENKGEGPGDGGEIIPNITFKNTKFSNVGHYTAVFEADYDVDIKYNLRESGIYLKPAGAPDSERVVIKNISSGAENTAKITVALDGHVMPNMQYEVNPFVKIIYTDGNGTVQAYEKEGYSTTLKTLASGVGSDIEILKAKKYRHVKHGPVLEVDTHAAFKLLPEENFERQTITLEATTSSGFQQTFATILPEHTGMYSRQGTSYECTYLFRFKGNSFYDKTWFDLTSENEINGCYTVRVNAGGSSYDIETQSIRFNIVDEL